VSFALYELHELISENGVFTDGDWVESKDQDQNGDVRLIQLADIGIGEFINKSNRFMTSQKAKELRCTFLEPGDILVARMPDPIGRACIFPGLTMPCVTVVDICIVRPASKYVDPKWLMHMLNSKKFNNKILQYVTGTTRQRISRGNLAKLEVPLPPLAEQKRIAAILDKADAIRRKRQQAIQLADDFLRAVFLDMFGDPLTNPKEWRAVKLGDICDVGSSKRVFVDEFTESGIPFYRGTEVGRLGENEDIQPHLFISNDHYENLKKHSGVPEIGDLLLPSICHDGRIWKVDHKDPFYFKDGRVLWIKVNQSSINSDYLRSYLRNLFLANYSSIASGTTFVELKIVILKELSVLSPPLDLQIKFAEITDKTIKKYKLNRGFLEKSDELFYSLSQKAFSDEL
jgi:type I restriction enzyme S subunit